MLPNIAVKMFYKRALCLQNDITMGVCALNLNFGDLGIKNVRKECR